MVIKMIAMIVVVAIRTRLMYLRNTRICQLNLVAEFTRPKKVYTFRFIAGNIIPKSVKCIHSATKLIRNTPKRNPELSKP